MRITELQPHSRFAQSGHVKIIFQQNWDFLGLRMVKGKQMASQLPESVISFMSSVVPSHIPVRVYACVHAFQSSNRIPLVCLTHFAYAEPLLGHSVPGRSRELWKTSRASKGQLWRTGDQQGKECDTQRPTGVKEEAHGPMESQELK